MSSTAPRIRNMQRSGIREIMDLAAGRTDVVHLEVGQPNFATPEHVIEAACRAAHGGFTTYTPNKGLLEVRQAMAHKLERFNKIVTSPDDVVISCGAVNALLESLMAVVSPGETILIPDPGWPNYQMMADVLDARAVLYPLVPEDGYLPDLDRLEQLALSTPGVKALIVNSPGNPTGAVFPASVMQRLVEIASRADLYLVSDECYEHVVYEGEHLSPAVFDTEGRVISVFSMSKSYAMTGWRVGYATGAPDVMELVAKIQEPLISCATAVSQKAAQAALEGDQSCVQEMTAAYRRRRDTVVDILHVGSVLVTVPNGSFYVLADISKVTDDSYAFARRLVAERGVAVAPGETFGPAGAGLVRLSLATSTDDLITGCQRLVAAVDEWRTS